MDYVYVLKNEDEDCLSAYPTEEAAKEALLEVLLEESISDAMEDIRYYNETGSKAMIDDILNDMKDSIKTFLLEDYVPGYCYIVKVPFIEKIVKAPPIEE